jgi:hypothetical protein
LGLGRSYLPATGRKYVINKLTGHKRVVNGLTGHSLNSNPIYSYYIRIEFASPVKIVKLTQITHCGLVRRSCKKLGSMISITLFYIPLPTLMELENSLSLPSVFLSL